MSGPSDATGIPTVTLLILIMSVFTVSIGYGVVLPLLPSLIERLQGSDGDATGVSRATGLLTGLYTLALFLFAPLWGHLSDRFGRRPVLVVGLAGFGATMLAFAVIETLVAVYAEHFLSGMFAAAVMPVALAVVGDLATTETARARRLTFVSLAGITGFLLGPMTGTVLTQGTAGWLPSPDSVAGSLTVPLAGTALLSLLVSIAVSLTVSDRKRVPPVGRTGSRPSGSNARLVPRLLALSFIVSAGIGVFEVGLALRGKQELGLTSYETALMFTACSVVMLIVQAIVFSPFVKPEWTRWLIAPALAVLAGALVLVPRAPDFPTMLVVIGAVAASAGILSPIVTYWISSRAGAAQGAQMGRQTAATSLGAAFGSAAGGLLFGLAWLPDASFLLAAALAVSGVAISIGLPRQLSPDRALGDADGT
jgi:MFS family permease